MSNGSHKFIGSEFVLIEETRTIDEILASLIGNPGEMESVGVADITPDETLVPGDYEVPEGEEDFMLDEIMHGRPGGYYPVHGSTDFGYDVPLTTWTHNGVAISDDEALRIFAAMMVDSEDSTSAQQDVEVER